jgi:hypothetical protein
MKTKNKNQEILMRRIRKIEQETNIRVFNSAIIISLVITIGLIFFYHMLFHIPNCETKEITSKLIVTPKASIDSFSINNYKVICEDGVDLVIQNGNYNIYNCLTIENGLCKGEGKTCLITKFEKVCK